MSRKLFDVVPTETEQGFRVLARLNIPKHFGGEYVILEYHEATPWLCWKHPDGQWVTVCKVQVPLALPPPAADGGSEEIGWLLESATRQQVDGDRVPMYLMSTRAESPNAAPEPVETWSADALASLLYVFADDHPQKGVGEAMLEAAKRLRAAPLPESAPEGSTAREPWAHAVRLHYSVTDGEVPSDWYMRLAGQPLPKGRNGVRVELIPLYAAPPPSAAGGGSAASA